MKISISAEKENPLLKRKELVVGIDHGKEATPSKAALQQLIAKQFNFDIESIDIRNIFSETGISGSRAKVFVWEEKKVPDLSVKKEKTEETGKKEEIKEKAGDEEK